MALQSGEEPENPWRADWKTADCQSEAISLNQSLYDEQSQVEGSLDIDELDFDQTLCSPAYKRRRVELSAELVGEKAVSSLSQELDHLH